MSILTMIAADFGMACVFAGSVALLFVEVAKFNSTRIGRDCKIKSWKDFSKGKRE